MESGLAGYLERASALLRESNTPALAAKLEEAVARISEALMQERPLLVCGNGGSATDAQHITGELVGRFLKERRALNVICLADNPAVLTAWSNDYSYDTVFARQVEAYGRPGAVLLGISTSGNSQNVVAAMEAAKAKSMVTIAMTGKGGGRLAQLCDLLIDVPSRHTPEIQQVHVCLYHYLCERVETLCA
ncbi:D-sedoheptulose-7-phosphate isomerase [Algihabitans sp.]|uniref:D-sedoheptulose-7-phosphate isomerase n=1 Tax=Algihabitans sp. TaxID=2821514 RepID=UPI003BA869F3